MFPSNTFPPIFFFRHALHAAFRCHLSTLEKAGWKIKVNLDAYVWHKVSSSRAGEFSFSNGYYGTRNRLFFAFQRTHNFIGGLVLLFLVLPARIVQWFSTGHLTMAKGTILGCLAFFRNEWGPRK